MAVLYIDLDRFKLLNESLGHEAADALLREVSRRLSQTLGEADTIARLSGDEFVVLLDAYGSLSGLAHLGSRLLQRIRKPIVIGEQELVISASIGVSLLPDNSRDAEVLLRGPAPPCSRPSTWAATPCSSSPTARRHPACTTCNWKTSCARRWKSASWKSSTNRA